MVLYGGTAGIELADLWTWDGQDWTPLGSSAKLGSRTGHAAVTDPVRGTIVLFGGLQASTSFDVTAEWSDVDWTIPATPLVSPRQQAAAALDTRRGRIVVFGGGLGPGNTVFNDTLELVGTSWVQPFDPGPSPPLPPGRVAHAMAYHAARGQTVMFGGAGGGSPLGDTWTYAGGPWTEVTGSADPPPRVGHAMAYDARRSEILLFGGAVSIAFGSMAFGDTWRWNGTWSMVTPAANLPRARQQHVVAYDPIRERVVLFGGTDGNGVYFDDTWEWDGDTQTWTDKTPASRPFARAAAAMAWDPARRRIVMFGGGNTQSPVLDDAWEWDGSLWSRLPLALSPQGRSLHVAVAAADGAGVVVFAGAAAPFLFPRQLDDLWELQWQGTRADDQCLDRSDRDGDGLRGCDDPDCWSRCTPLCSPGVICDASAPRCGDGVCNAALETCHLCPGDCGTCVAVCGDFACDPGESVASCPGDC